LVGVQPAAVKVAFPARQVVVEVARGLVVLLVQEVVAG
jgi:hypothetical protein